MNPYNLLRETCGISQAEAAEYHDARLDSVKSWCSDRRSAPEGVIREIKKLAKDIHNAGITYAVHVQSISALNNFIIGIPHDDRDARHCGFPSLSAAMRAVSITVLSLPDGVTHIKLRERGERPINIIPAVVNAVFSLREVVKYKPQPQLSGKPRLFPNKHEGREARGLQVIEEFKVAGGDPHQMLKFYRDEFNEPNDRGFGLLEKIVLG